MTAEKFKGGIGMTRAWSCGTGTIFSFLHFIIKKILMKN